MNKILILLFIGILFSSCTPKKYDVIKKEDVVTSQDAKFIDVISAIEGYQDDNILDYTGDSWSVAVRNLETDDIYYFDSGNNFHNFFPGQHYWKFFRLFGASDVNFLFTF